MYLKAATVSVVLAAALISFYKFDLFDFGPDFEEDTCDIEKIKIWTATTVEKYDESIYDVINKVARQLNHSVIKESNENGTWDILWTHEYVFDRFPLNIKFMSLKPHQLINHIPGLTFMTNKLHLAVSTVKAFIPSAFNFPQLKNEFLYYSKLFPDYKFVIKNMDKGGIEIVPFEKVNFSMGSFTYLQKFVESHLIDGHAFDIGVYVILTSLDPLRLYKWDHDIDFRFCSEPYEPFDLNVKQKYVCSLRHKMPWQMERFKDLIETQKFTNKELLNNYINSKGQNASKLWHDIDVAINTVVVEKAITGIRFAKVYTSRSGNSIDQMFELLRFDFMIDNEFNCHMMEINMSPDMNGLDDKHERKEVMNMQIIHNVLKIVGAESYHELKGNSSTVNLPQTITTNIEECSQCDDSCESPSCELCLPCIPQDFQQFLHKSYREHNRRGHFKRIYPRENYLDPEVNAELTENTKKLLRWFAAKCRNDEDWC